jgi:hypothetical protein
MNEHHAPPSVPDFAIGIGGVISPWWLEFVHGFNATIAAVTFYGGALLVAIQLWRYAASRLRKWRGDAS